MLKIQPQVQNNMNFKFKAVPINFIIIFLLLFIVISSRVNANGDSPDETKTENLGDIQGVSFNAENYNLNVENVAEYITIKGDDLRNQGVKSFTAKNIGTVNIESSIDSIDSISIENGYAKINFIKGKSSATFEINGKGYTFNSDGGYVEWKQDGIFISKNMDLFTLDKEFNELQIHSNSNDIKIIIEDNEPIVVGEDSTDVVLSNNVIFMTPKGKRIKSIQDGTNIRMEKDIPTIVKGKISVDYKTSPFKINLYGTYTSLELNTADDEKFEFKNIDQENNLLVTISSIDKYMFHDGCKTNCISYRNMGKGHSGDPWDKIKIDGAAKIIKYKDNEKGYSLTFSDGKATIGRKFLASMRDIPFNKKTVINYNNGDIGLTIFTSQEEAINKRNDLKKELESSIERIKRASDDLIKKEEEFEKLKDEMGYEELPEELPEELEKAKKALDDAESELDSARKQKESLILQIEDIKKTTLWVKGNKREGNLEIISITAKEVYESSIERLWFSTHWFREIKGIYDVDIHRAFKNFPYVKEEIIYKSKEIRFNLYNKDPDKYEEYSIYEVAEKYSVKFEDMPILIALWEQEIKWSLWDEKPEEWNPDIINENGLIGIGQLSPGALADVALYYSNEFPEYRQYAKSVDKLTKSEKNEIKEELKNREVNVKVSAYYFRMVEDKYGFKKLENQLMAYNAGPTVTTNILNEFEKTGKTSWKDCKEFLRSEEGGLKFISSGKAKEIIGYVENICGTLGYNLV